MQDLKTLLMQEVGLAVDPTGNIIDQDTMQTVRFRNKTLKNDKTKGFRHNDIVFDPQNNIRQMESLFRYATSKDEIEILSYGNTQNTKDGKYTCVVATNDGIYESKGYNNPTLGYAENILKMYGTVDTDLSEYDRDEN